jgi:disulfide bond formation protein DsbB
MAGVTVPSVFLLLVFAVLCVVRLAYNPEFPIERILVFPLALVPAIWGVWNMVYLAMHTRRYMPLGCHGALVPVFLVPVALWNARAFGVELTLAASWHIVIVALPLLMIIYYLVWKFLVGFLNELLGIA